jgi:uncharacterized protein DUF4350
VTGLRRWGPWALVVALLALLAVAGASNGPGAPLDPGATGPNGAKALVLLLRAYGATVTVDHDAPAPGVRTAVVLRDQLGADRRRAVRSWVQAGGRLVVADPTSPDQPGAPVAVGSALVRRDLHPVGPCPELGLGDVERLSVGPSLMLRVPPGEALRACFDVDAPDGPASFVVAQDLGAGTVIGLGGAGALTNARLAQDDNAAFAVDLLEPRPGDAVDVLVAGRAGGGSRSMLALLDPRLKSAVLELLVAFGVLAWWKGRRLGRPVPSGDPVALPAAELVVAVGDLLARTRNRDAAARQLRSTTRAWLGERVGVGTRASPQQVADAAAGRFGWTREQVLGLLADAPLADEAALVDLARSLALLRTEVTRGSPHSR